jgi:hypothetical protein
MSRHSRLAGFLAVLLALLSGPVDAARAIAWMSEAELNRAFAGKTIDGHYESGVTFTETYRRDGTIDYREESRQLAGRWSLVNGTFCTIYDTSPTGGCFRVHQVSRNCFEFYYQARTETEARRPEQGRPGWTARAWRTSDPATCKEMPTV